MSAYYCWTVRRSFIYFDFGRSPTLMPSTRSCRRNRARRTVVLRHRISQLSTHVCYGLKPPYQQSQQNINNLTLFPPNCHLVPHPITQTHNHSTTHSLNNTIVQTTQSFQLQRILHLFTMQFFNAIIVFASLAAAAPAADNAPAVEARQAKTNTPCGSNIQPVWNTGNYGKGDGGWGVSFHSFANIVLLILILL